MKMVSSHCGYVNNKTAQEASKIVSAFSKEYNLIEKLKKDPKIVRNICNEHYGKNLTDFIKQLNESKIIQNNHPPKILPTYTNTFTYLEKPMYNYKQNQIFIPENANLNQNNNPLLSTLENRKQDLIADISAAYKQLGTSLSEVDKTRINRLIKDLESELADIQIKIDSSTNITSQNQSQPKVDINPTQKATTMDRKTLFNQLAALVPGQFNQLLFEINPTNGVVPSSSAPQAERVSALLQWAESSTGCGLAKVQEVLQTILNP